MGGILYTRRAEADLRRLQAFIVDENPAVAAGLVEQLLERIELLADFPRLGRHVASSFHEVILLYGKSGYVVRYRVKNEAVVITRIWHGKENRSA